MTSLHDAILRTEVCHNVATEPPLQPLTGETIYILQHDLPSLMTMLDWNNYQDAFFNVMVFSHNALSNRSADAYKRHEQAKKREHSQRAREVEHGEYT